MDIKKQTLVNSIISFLRDELAGHTLSEEKKESIEVSIQCLETAFDTENQKCTEKVDLLRLIKVEKSVDVTDEQKAEAEQYKTKGNEFMKGSQYEQALEEYAKAIQLNPYNAVYYCNRAAAYTRLLKDQEAISDCQEAIKLDPTYGKAYGRLGISYSNLNKYDLALKAYETALKYDPSNAMYETNLKVAQERLASTRRGTDASLPGNLSEFINNPNIINMASQVLSDQNFHSMMSALINNVSRNGGEGMPGAVETMLQAGQALAQRVVNEDPDFYNRVVRNVQTTDQNNPNADSSTPDSVSSNKPPEKKDEGSA
ncbi:small glutamine-rich tetratricopeptide repeat-containing protein alpha-like [Euwallacea fornicatus]|uniref:small glutamine-rich tetratricopeptide repeat-containing protein alpha-like n=1 Tax=Euwallacea fornicatus TaxID=995702 RepID=UPI00338ECE56